ncbi:protein lin-52 homolog, partial [Ctenocephalides felis]
MSDSEPPASQEESQGEEEEIEDVEEVEEVEDAEDVEVEELEQGQKQLNEKEDASKDDEPILNESLMSMEKMDRSSPELWPEQIPGVTEYVSAHMSSHSNNSTLPVWLSPLTSEDIDLMHRLATHSTRGLISEIKTLHDLAYQLGVEEAREMTRGKYLKIFS